MALSTFAFFRSPTLHRQSCFTFSLSSVPCVGLQARPPVTHDTKAGEAWSRRLLAVGPTVNVVGLLNAVREAFFISFNLSQALSQSCERPCGAGTAVNPALQAGGRVGASLQAAFQVRELCCRLAPASRAAGAPAGTCGGGRRPGCEGRPRGHLCLPGYTAHTWDGARRPGALLSRPRFIVSLPTLLPYSRFPPFLRDLS